MGNSMSVDHVSPPLEYASDEDDKIPFAPDGNDPMLSCLGTAMRVRPKTGRIAGVEVAVRKTIRIMEVDLDQLQRDKNKLRRAAARLSRVRHPHMLRTIATYFYNGHNGVQFSVVVDFVQENLLAYLAPSLETAPTHTPRKRWFGCLIEVVAYLHRRGIRHRDIRPESILVRDGETVLLSNFDVAEMDAWKGQQTVSDLTWGRWKMTWGNRYGAPETEEEAGKIPRGRPADIFSLGAVFLEMLLASHDRRGSPSDKDDDGNKQKLGPVLESKLGSQKTGTAKSYAHNVDAVGSWLAGLTLSSSPSPNQQGRGWEAEVLSLCRVMLDLEPGARPRADELSSKWKSVAGKDPSLQCDVCVEREAQGDDVTSTVGNASSGADADAGVDTTDGPRETDLFRAVGRSSEDEVRALLEKNAAATDVNERNMDGWSALHYAVRMNRHRVVELLLSKGADIDLADNAGWTALHFAAWGGYKDVLRRLLDKGANVMAVTKRGHTALHLAAKGGHPDVVNMLLEKMDEADVNKKTRRGQSAIWMAAAGGHLEVLKLLVGSDKVDIRALAM